MQWVWMSLPIVSRMRKMPVRERFTAISYEEISKDTFHEKFDVVVCNFSLLGKESVKHIFTLVPSILHRHGSLIVQTLHPILDCGEEPYEDGWARDHWVDLANSFTIRRPGILGRLIPGRSFFIGTDLRLMKSWSQYTHIPSNRHRLFCWKLDSQIRTIALSK